MRKLKNIFQKIFFFIPYPQYVCYNYSIYMYQIKKDVFMKFGFTPLNLRDVLGRNVWKMFSFGASN